MLNSNPFQKPKNLLSAIARRGVFIWGARHEGYAARVALQRLGIAASGYIDSSPSLAGTSAFGLSITNPVQFFKDYLPENSFIIVASGFFADEIAERCVAEGWQKGEDFTVYGELRHFNYQVDVSGMCNLKCISCPRGNWPRHRKPGLMPAETYLKLLDKILADDPWTGIITLYNWGEPLLNPALPEIISTTKNRGVLSAVSSNLAMKKDFEDVVKAGPDWFRISNSGWGENYEYTHTGSQWEVFYSNCLKLSEYKERHHPDMIVEFFFHIYDHNRMDFQKINDLCIKLGFTLRYRHAALAPLDNIERIIDGGQITESAAKTRKIQFLHVEEVMDIARAERNRPCYYRDHLWIDWDLSIAHCMEWYDPALKLFDRDFLSVTLEEIDAVRTGSEHCRRCMEKGIHRVYCVYGDEKLIAAKSSIPVQKEE